jgi:hypothetical protein
MSAIIVVPSRESSNDVAALAFITTRPIGSIYIVYRIIYRIAKECFGRSSRMLASVHALSQ